MASGFYLAVDTATEACSVAVWLDGAVLERFERLEREHTQRLLPLIDAVLAESGRPLTQLDGLVCGIGPGSFAGLRIGLGVVKGLALARSLPVTGVSSLAMLAQRAVRLAGAAHVAAGIDARMKEVYVGAYRRGDDGLVRAIRADQVCAPTAAEPLPPAQWHGVGTAWAAYEPELRRSLQADIVGVDGQALPHAEEALRLGVPELQAGRGRAADELAPAYLRDRVALTLEEQAALRRR